MIFQFSILKLLQQNLAVFVYSSARRASSQSTFRKFWKTVNVSTSTEGYRVMLDGFPIKTPSKQVLVIPLGKRDLAYAIAHEWDCLNSSKVKYCDLILTSIVSRALEMDPQDARKTVLPYLNGDTILYLSEPSHCEGELRARQEAEFPRLKEWAEELWQTKLDFSTGFGVPLVQNQGNVIKWVDQLDNWRLAGLERSSTATKSLILGAALIEGYVSAEDCVRLARLEVEMQSKRWGFVEDGHDIDLEDLKRQVGSSSIVTS